MNSSRSLKGVVGTVLALLLSAIKPGMARAEDPASILRSFLHARALCERPHGGAQEAFLYLRPRKESAKDEDCLVLIEQPMWEAFVMVLVFDPTAIGNQTIFVEVSESATPLPSQKATITALKEAYPNSGLFMGRTDVEGSHSTPVVVRYRTAKNKMPKQSNLIFMAFH